MEASISGYLVCKTRAHRLQYFRRGPDLWEIAQRQIDGDLSSFPVSDTSDRRDILADILVIVREAEQASLQKRWKWKNRKGEVVILRDVFAKIAVWVDRLKSIGDIIVQYDPVHSALPWAAARFLLQVSCDRYLDIPQPDKNRLLLTMPITTEQCWKV